MENDEINKNLDTILSILKLRVKNAGGIQSYLKDAYQMDLSQIEINMLLKQLKDDNYITIDEANAGRCYVTTPGGLFDGYQSIYKEAQNASKESAALKVHQMEVDLAIVENSTRLNKLTFRILIVYILLAVIGLATVFVMCLQYAKKS